MPLNNITITGQLGPGVTTTSKPFSDVVRLDFQLERAVLFIHYRNPGETFVQVQSYELANIATVTYTIASGAATVVAST